MARYRTAWTKGLNATAATLKRLGKRDNALSYSIHLPLIIHKAKMMEAIRLANEVSAVHVHLRTLYGVTADLGGEEYVDPKVLRRGDPFPRGPWMSSSPDSFRTSVEPVLRYLFPDESSFER
jgi:hypothetical protein